MKIWGEAKHFIKKVPEWGEVGICSKKMGGGRYFSKEIGYLTHQIQELQSLKWGGGGHIHKLHMYSTVGGGSMKQEDE